MMFGVSEEEKKESQTGCSVSSGPTHKRTEARALLWGFYFTTKAATPQRGSQENWYLTHL